MDDREAVLRLLDPEHGLRCLPRFWKSWLRDSVVCNLAPDELAHYRRSRLAMIERFFEPLVRSDQAAYNSAFAELCETLTDSAGDVELCARLGVPPAEPGAALDWHAWAELKQGDPTAAVYCLAGAWSSPAPACGDRASRDGFALRVMVDQIPILAPQEQFAIWLEEWIGLADKHYADPVALRARLSSADCPLAEIGDANTVAHVISRFSQYLLFRDGRRNGAAAAVLEGWLGLDSQSYENSAAVRRRLSSEDCPIRRVTIEETKVNLISGLAEHVRLTRGRGSHAALALLEGFLDVGPEDLRTALAVRRWIDAEDCSLKLLDATSTGIFARATTVASLASSLIGVSERGPREALALLEGCLGIREEDYRSSKALWERIRAAKIFSLPEPLGISFILHHEVHSAGPAVRPRPGTSAAGKSESNPMLEFGRVVLEGLMIGPLSQALIHVADRGPAATITLLEGWLGLEPEDYSDPEALRHRLSSPDNPAMNRDCAIILCMQLIPLAHALIGQEDRGAPAARALLEGWLGLRPADYENPAKVARRMRDPGCPLTWLKTDRETSAGNVVAALARAILLSGGDAGLRGVVSLIEGWLGLMPPDYVDADSVRRRLHGKDCPLSAAGIGLVGAATVALLAEAMAATADRGARPGLLLLEGWLDGPMAAFAQASRLEGAPAVNRINLVHCWLNLAQAAGASDGAVEATCEALVRYVATTRDGLDSFGKRRDFLAQALRLMGVLRRVALRRADSLRREDDHAEADRVELQLLHWIEQFRNRVLVEELLDRVGRPAGLDGASLADASGPEPWPLRHVPRLEWHELTEGPGALSDKRLVDTLAECTFSNSALDIHETGTVTPLQPSDAGESIPEAADPAATARREELAEVLARRTHLRDLLPDGAVWVSTLFEDDGTLRWWAVRREAKTVRVLARGRSSDQALERLTGATLAFDLAVLAAWRAHDDTALPISARPWLDALNTFLTRPELLRQWRTSVALDPALGRIEKLSALGRQSPSFAAFLMHATRLMNDPDLTNAWPGWSLVMTVAFRIVVHLGLRAVDSAHELPQGMIESWRGLFESWPRPKDRAGWWTLGQQLRLRLDEANDRYLRALTMDMDLRPLREAAPEIDFDQTDVLIRAEGPLLAAPLAWLPFGARGEPLFRSVASTSTVVSLALRAVGEAEAARAGASSQALLSCHWLEVGDWQRMRGLAQLHAYLLESFRDWTVWGLGDKPHAEARTEVLLSLLRRVRFDVVVIGGHGNAHRAGVKLKDDCWCGEGADLGAVDLVVFVACAVGRVSHDGDRDIEGLYSRLLVNRGRSVIAARWKIADAEAARFIAEVLDQYRRLREHASDMPFARARALNQARRNLVGPVEDPTKVSFHLASAFEVYGRG
jgi:hypothetical protein